MKNFFFQNFAVQVRNSRKYLEFLITKLKVLKNFAFFLKFQNFSENFTKFQNFSKNFLKLKFKIFLISDNVQMEFGHPLPLLKGTKQGRIYLTTHRVIFNAKNPKDQLQSFSSPFISMHDVSRWKNFEFSMNFEILNF